MRKGLVKFYEKDNKGNADVNDFTVKPSPIIFVGNTLGNVSS